MILLSSAARTLLIPVLSHPSTHSTNIPQKPNAVRGTQILTKTDMFLSCTILTGLFG